MTAGALLDKASRLYLQNFSLMFSISAIVHIPSIALNIVRSARNVTGTRASFPAAMLELLAILIEFFVIFPWTGGAATQAVSEIYLGNEVTLAGALRAAWSRYGTLLKSHFIPVLAFLVGLVMLVVPGILWYVSYIFITPIVMIEGLSHNRDIRQRSRALVQGYRGKAFVIVAANLFILILSQAGLRSLTRFFIGAAVTTNIAPLLNGSVGILVSPMSSLAMILLYYDLRIRKEGYDLELLCREIGGNENGTRY